MNYQVKKKYTTIDLFSGLGGIRLGFEKFGCINVFSSEIDQKICKIYKDNFNEMPFGDINLIAPEKIPDHDILLAGFPCQPFSIAGKGLGFGDTRGTLFFNIESIISAKKPKAFLLENVKRLVSHDNGNTFKTILDKLNKLGYSVHYKVLNSLEYGGVPQKRERIYIVGFDRKTDFHFPEEKIPYKHLSEILERDVDEKYFLSKEMVEKRQNKLKSPPIFPSIWHENIAGNISVLPYSCALRAGGSYNYLVVNGIRRLTGREMLRLQGFPDTYKIDAPYTHVRHAAGNSVTVSVIERIAKNIVKELDSYDR